MSSGAADTSLGIADMKKRPLLLDLVIKLIKEKPLGTVGGVIVLVLLFTGVFADLAWLGLPEIGLAPYGLKEFDLENRLMPPSAQFPLGTDTIGRDMLTRVIFGARVSVIVGLSGTMLATLVSTVLGILSGFLGGKFDMVVQRFVDAFMCFPSLLLLITLMSLLGPGLMQIILVLGLIFGISGSRVIRGAVIGIKENMYMYAAVAVGASTTRILLRHILPNVMAPIIVLFTTRMGSVILAEASMSFLGFGIPPPQPSWGGMLSGPGREYMLQAPWMVLWPGLALSLVVYGINMLGDAVRDLLDPRLRGGLGRYGGVKAKKLSSIVKEGKKS